MQRRARLMTGALVVLGALALAGCAGTGSSAATSSSGDHPWTPTSSASAGPSPSSASSANGTLTASNDPLYAKYGPAPLDAFLPSDADSQASTAADTLLMTECMKAKGFDYTTDSDGSAIPYNPPWSQFLGLTNMARAKAYGYQSDDLEGLRIKMGLATPATPPAHDGDQAYWSAIYGKSAFDSSSKDQGCRGQVSAELSTSKAGVDVSLLGELAQQAEQSAQANSAVRQALATWVSCMASHGYSDKTPPMAASTADVTQADIDKAVTDVTCKQSSNLTDTYITTLYQAENNLIASHRSGLDAMVKWQNANADKARRVLSEHQ